MNWQHFRAFVWLRWRLFVNQQRRGGTANLVVVAIVAVLAAVAAVVMAVALFFVGLFALRNASPAALMFTWDGLAAAFLMFWLIGLVAELQRAEALSLDKFLHLPVSLSSAFAINYFASFVRVSMIFFLPAMLGLSLGLLFSRGPSMLLLFPLLAAFVLALTAVTYQFQGWLAALMSNPRRRRTVIVIATATIILLAQLPNILNLLHSRPTPDQRERSTKSAEVRRQEEEQMENTARLINAVVPPGWLPYGAYVLAEGNVVPALLGTLGLGLIGAVSLWRAYRTTLRIYTGQTGPARRKPATSANPAGVPSVVGIDNDSVKAGTPTSAAPRFLERRIPGFSEQTAAIALACFRGLVRAPEAKMMLLSPVIMLVVFGSMFLTRPTGPAEASRPWIATGAIAMVLLSMGQLIGNQFGFDRAGFRVFVLCSAPRGDILLGKNLSFAPLALGLVVAVLVILQVVYPMRPDLFLATLPQAVTMFLLYCLAANLLSILAPMPVAAGSLRPTNTRFA
ncbi:MAG TPA: hypothetical protein VH120_11640, partial [Gemmataceae bacterium]|nr:hypothetical protein [Gemmataceae bacterium]